MDIFEKFLMEADDAPDLQPDTAPPDIPNEGDVGTTMDDPPDMGNPDDVGDMGDIGEDPPEMGMDDTGNDFGMDDQGDDSSDSEEDQNDGMDLNQDGNIGLDDKVSAILNNTLYQKYLSLLSNISQELSSIRNNNDIVYALSDDASSIVDSLNRLDENIRLYMKNSFQNENYSKNLLFFNKCLNLLKLLNDSFNSSIKKGMHSMK